LYNKQEKTDTVKKEVFDVKLSYLSYFFTYETNIPKGVGFTLFGFWHIVWLLVIFAGCAGYVRIYKNGNKKRQCRMERLSAFSLVGWIVVRTFYIGMIHEEFLYELPFHLCSMAGILCAVHCLTKWKWLGQVLYTICLPGTVLALLFPNWNFYPVIHFITLEAFLFHMGIVWYVAGELASHEICPDLKKIWQVVLFLTVVVIPIYGFDKKYDVNYMFVNWPSAGSPLVWLADRMGNPGYLTGYAALVFLCMLLMDVGYLMVAGRRKQKLFF
jgi:hypothetical integral membrane protein (TIGR02206 family)